MDKAIVMRKAWANYRRCNVGVAYSATSFGWHLRHQWSLARQQAEFQKAQAERVAHSARVRAEQDALLAAMKPRTAGEIMAARNEALAAEFTKWGTN